MKTLPEQLLCTFATGNVEFVDVRRICGWVDMADCADPFEDLGLRQVYAVDVETDGSEARLVEVELRGPWHNPDAPLSIVLHADGFQDWHGYGTDH